MPQASPYVLHGHFDVAPPAIVPTTVTDDVHACMDRIEQHMRQMRVSDGSVIWDDFEDVSRRELKALRQRIDESVSSFIFCWRGKIAEIIDRPSEEGLATNGFEESATQDFQTRGRGEETLGGQRSVDVSAIGSSSQKSPRRYLLVPRFPETHPSYPPQQYRPRAPRPAYDQTYVPQTLALSYYATQGIERPPVSYTATEHPCYAAQFVARLTASYPRLRAQQTSAPFALKTHRQFSHLGMSLS
ncbi:hypothetical protein CK203_022371 [Vitis vinifera]|uniref:Uncharacterized protein n=1 Tax=Vitis vinifera TaxID=29760 RepID=A0A438I987_VITVI|nr:hypothetical protein CK203_022371 [Vitis vinifera]